MTLNTQRMFRFKIKEQSWSSRVGIQI